MASGVQMETATGELALPPLPARPAREEVSVVPRTRWWVEALVIVWLCWVYDAVNNLAPLRVHAALAHGWGVLHLERSLGLDPEVALNRWLAGHHTLGLLLSDYYDNAHFVVTLGLLGWLWYRRADIYRPLRNVLVTINVLGLAVFWLYPTAPPRLLAGGGFDDVVASTGALGGWHTGPLAAAANQFAAMPSLHMAWAVWCSVAMWSLSRYIWVPHHGGRLPVCDLRGGARHRQPLPARRARGRGHRGAGRRAGTRRRSGVARAWWCTLLFEALYIGPKTDVVPPRSLRGPRGAGDNPRGACHKVVTKSSIR